MPSVPSLELHETLDFWKCDRCGKVLAGEYDFANHLQMHADEDEEAALQSVIAELASCHDPGLPSDGHMLEVLVAHSTSQSKTEADSLSRCADALEPPAIASAPRRLSTFRSPRLLEILLVAAVFFGCLC